MAQKLNERSTRPRAPMGPEVTATERGGAAEAPTRVTPSWVSARIADTPFGLYTIGSESTPITLQPWARSLVNVCLEAADSGGIHLCLLWPVELNQLAQLHGVASLHRISLGDFHGLRTGYFPGSHSTRLAYQSVAVDRTALTKNFTRHFHSGPDGTTFDAPTRSRSLEAVMQALTEIEHWNKPAARPPLAALIPSFIWEAGSDQWASSPQTQLDAALVNVHKRGNRREARAATAPEWGDAVYASGALMVLHNSATKRTWKQAFSARASTGEASLDLFLLDATAAAAKSHPNAVRRIPDLLRAYLETRPCKPGTVIVTDDPRTYFGIRSRLAELHVNATEHVWAAEADESLLSASPVAVDWMPKARDNARCDVAIVDKEAGQVASRLLQLANEVGGDEHTGHQPLLEAFLYLLRLSNLPAGIKDLADELADLNGDSFANEKYSWASVVANLQGAIESGVLSHKKLQIERAIAKAGALVSAWVDSTPMAERLLADVRAHGLRTLVIVLPNRHYVALAKRFLQRRLGEEWAAIESRIEWHTLASFAYQLRDHSRHRHYTIVGLNPRVLRLVLTHPDLPHGTHILLSHQKADSAIKTLRAMKPLDAFKPYRGRMGLLEQELSKRLEEMPPLPLSEKLGEFSMTFDLTDSSGSEGGGEQALYRFDLDGTRPVYASGWVYRYDAEEGTGFRRTAAKDVQVGHLLFDMSDALRTRFEEALDLSSGGSTISHHPARALLKLYHNEVQARCMALFPEAVHNRAKLARAIWDRMLELGASADAGRADRVQYWLDLGEEGDQRPHAARDVQLFKLFCAALGMPEDRTNDSLVYVRNARRLNQEIGRELAARYAEILFQPESAVVYRKIPPAVIEDLRREAILSVFRVSKITPPASARR